MRSPLWTRGPCSKCWPAARFRKSCLAPRNPLATARDRAVPSAGPAAPLRTCRLHIRSREDSLQTWLPQLLGLLCARVGHMAPLQSSSWSHVAHRPAHSKSSPMQIGIAVVFTWTLLLNLGQLASTRAPGCLTQSKTSEALSGGSRRGACAAPSSPARSSPLGLGPRAHVGGLGPA